MSPTMASLGLDKLSWDERVVLAHQLLMSVEAERKTCSLTVVQAAELDRRLAEDDANPDDVFTWEEVKAEGRLRMAKVSVDGFSPKG